MEKIIPPDIYDSDYFLNYRGGADEFRKTKGKSLCEAHGYALSLADVRIGDRVLDIGCGCGEVVLNSALLGASAVGIDYSPDAIRLANEAKSEFPEGVQKRANFVNADISGLALGRDRYDKIFFLDVIEHLRSDQIFWIVSKMYSAIKHGGKLIVHTWPNRWHREYTYPVSYLLGKHWGKKRPKDPRTKHEQLMHINEQSPVDLYHNISRRGFIVKVHFKAKKMQIRSFESFIYYFFHNVIPLKWFFCDHLWAVGKKV